MADATGWFLSSWVSWVVAAPIVVAIAIGAILYFRSLRRWRQQPPSTPDQIQAEMRLDSESRLTDRW